MFSKSSAEGGDTVCSGGDRSAGGENKSSVLQDSALLPKAGWSQVFFNTI